jgi:hypothetical protein
MEQSGHTNLEQFRFTEVKLNRPLLIDAVFLLQRDPGIWRPCAPPRLKGLNKVIEKQCESVKQYCITADCIVNRNSKIPWYPKLLFQRENAFASFWPVQRVLVTHQARLSRVMIKHNFLL